MGSEADLVGLCANGLHVRDQLDTKGQCLYCTRERKRRHRRKATLEGSRAEYERGRQRIRYATDPEYRERRKAHSRKRHSDPLVREARAMGLSTSRLRSIRG